MTARIKVAREGLWVHSDRPWGVHTNGGVSYFETFRRALAYALHLAGLGPHPDDA